MHSILTFYSYKGGVGRTMALANIAILLARKGLRVLMVDWDLEAPGLHRYFSTFNTIPSEMGLLELLVDSGKLQQVPDWHPYSFSITVDKSTNLTLIPAGRFNEEYEKRVLEFDWGNFFQQQNGGDILESIRQQWIAEFDITLIDSRTGISDTGGICTVQMPDILVPVFSPNYQSLEGTKQVVQKAHHARQNLAYDRTRLLIFPLLSRFDSRTEYHESQTWLRRSAEELHEFYLDWLPKETAPLQILERTKIPYVPFFSFGEKLPVIVEGTTDPESMGFAYENAASLIANGFQEANKLISRQSASFSTEKASIIPKRDWLNAFNRAVQSIDDIIAQKDVQRFKMLLEMARGVLIEMWESYQVGGPGLPADIPQWNIEIADFYQKGFVPALNSIVDLAVLVIRYDASVDWVSLIIDLLIECFEESRRFDRLKSPRVSSEPNALHFARPAYDAYLGWRAIATYAIARKRYQFLLPVLSRFVRLFTIDNTATILEPLLFWPFRGEAVAGLTDMRQGRNQSLWNDHIGRAWGTYFGNFEGFLSAAAQLEFVLEFNSYLFEGVQIPEIKRLLNSLVNKSFAYLPDFWVNRLDPVIPLAEYFYDILRDKPTLPAEFAVEKQAIDLAFSKNDASARLLFLGGYLLHLKTWQGQAMMQQNRFPFMFEWSGRLGELVAAARQHAKNQSS